LLVGLLVSLNISAQDVPREKEVSKQDTLTTAKQQPSPKKVQGTGGVFGDDDQQSPTSDGSSGDFGDADQQNPSTEGGSGVFGDNDQQSPTSGGVRGDVNGDSQVSIADVTALVNVILGKGSPNAAADVNGDGLVSIADVAAVVNIILKK